MSYPSISIQREYKTAVPQCVARVKCEANGAAHRQTLKAIRLHRETSRKSEAIRLDRVKIINDDHFQNRMASFRAPIPPYCPETFGESNLPNVYLQNVEGRATTMTSHFELFGYVTRGTISFPRSSPLQASLLKLSCCKCRH